MADSNNGLDKITVLNPVGYPPKSDGSEAAGAAARQPRRQDRLPGRLPLRRLATLPGADAGAGSPSTCRSVKTRSSS